MSLNNKNQPSRAWNWRQLFYDRKNFAAIAAGDASSSSGHKIERLDSNSFEKMVRDVIEETNENQNPNQPPPATKCCRRISCSNCFYGNDGDSSDDYEFFSDAADKLKSLIPCSSDEEEKLLLDVTKIIEISNMIDKTKENMRNVVADVLSSIGYDSSVCICKWDKTSSHPAGEHEFIDVIIGRERLLVEIDFRSEFEIARSTEKYKEILQSLPCIFVGKSERLDQIVTIVSEATKKSMKKKKMPFPPWRTAEYMKAKWLSDHTRMKENGVNEELEKKAEPTMTWEMPPSEPKNVGKGKKVVTGLTAILRERN